MRVLSRAVHSAAMQVASRAQNPLPPLRLPVMFGVSRRGARTLICRGIC